MKSKTELGQGWAVILASERTDLFAEALVS